mgnify:CR=1 FL=1
MGKVDNNKHIVNSSDGKSGRSGLNVMLRLIGLVKPLAGYMAVAILMGLAGHLCASFITIFGGYAILDVSGYIRVRNCVRTCKGRFQICRTVV